MYVKLVINFLKQNYDSSDLHIYLIRIKSLLISQLNHDKI